MPWRDLFRLPAPIPRKPVQPGVQVVPGEPGDVVATDQFYGNPQVAGIIDVELVAHLKAGQFNGLDQHRIGIRLVGDLSGLEFRAGVI